MTGIVYGRTPDGRPVDDEMIERLADDAEQGFEPEQVRGRRRGPGRPPLGAAAKSVESVRLTLRCGPRSPSGPPRTACRFQRSSAGRWGST
jgi:hypothetical protein